MSNENAVDTEKKLDPRKKRNDVKRIDRNHSISPISVRFNVEWAKNSIIDAGRILRDIPSVLWIDDSPYEVAKDGKYSALGYLAQHYGMLSPDCEFKREIVQTPVRSFFSYHSYGIVASELGECMNMVEDGEEWRRFVPPQIEAETSRDRCLRFLDRCLFKGFVEYWLKE